MLFAGIVWGTVALFLVFVSFAIPSLKERGCLARLFFALVTIGSVFAGGMLFGLFFPELTNSIQVSAFLATMAGGGLLGAKLATNLVCFTADTNGSDQRRPGDLSNANGPISKQPAGELSGRSWDA